MKGKENHPPRKPHPTAPKPPPRPGYFRGPDGLDYGKVPPVVKRPEVCVGHDTPLDMSGVCDDCRRYGGPWAKRANQGPGKREDHV